MRRKWLFFSIVEGFSGDLGEKIMYIYIRSDLENEKANEQKNMPQHGHVSNFLMF